MSEIPLPLSGPWFSIAANGGGATVTVGNPDSVTVSVDVDEGELAFLLPVVTDWLDAVKEDPFQRWRWDEKAGECRPMDLQAWDEERERLARMDIEVLCLEPWIMIFREDERHVLSIRTGLKDKRRIGITEAEADGILLAIEAALPERWEPDYGGPLTIPLIERAVFDMMPPSWEPNDDHPIKLFGYGRPWARRRKWLLSDDEVDAISDEIELTRSLILHELGIGEQAPSSEGDAAPANPKDAVKHVLRVDTGRGGLSALNKAEIEDPYRRLDDPDGPYGIVIPWFKLGDGTYRLSVTVFANGRPALTVSGPVPADDDVKTLEQHLDSAGFEKMPKDVGEFVWMRARPEFDRSRRWDTNGRKVEKIDSEWGMLIKAFGSVTSDENVVLSDIVERSERPWPKALDNKKAVVGRIKVIQEFDAPVDDEGIYRLLFEFVCQATGKDLPWWDDWDDGTQINRLLMRHHIDHTTDPEEIIGLVKVAAILYADSRLGCAEIQCCGQDRKAIRYADVGQYLIDLSAMLEGDVSCWESVSETFDDLGEIALPLMGAALYERMCLNEGIPPSHVSRERLSENSNPHSDDPLSSLIDDPRPNVDLTNQMIERCLEIERDVADLVRSLGLAIKAGRAAFVESSATNARGWSEAVAVAKAAILDSVYFGQGNEYPLGTEKEVFSKATVDLRLAWDCLWIWMEATQKWPTSTAPGSKAKPTFIGFYRLVRDAVNVVEDLKVKERQDGDAPTGDDDGVNPAKKAMTGFLIQEQWNLTPPHVQVANPLKSDSGRFLVYGEQAAGPAGWYPRERASQSTSLLRRVDPGKSMRLAREKHLEELGKGKAVGKGKGKA